MNDSRRLGLQTASGPGDAVATAVGEDAFEFARGGERAPSSLDDGRFSRDGPVFRLGGRSLFPAAHPRVAWMANSREEAAVFGVTGWSTSSVASVSR